jgi:GNAT superfamily N-acetyltransferase
MDVCIREARSTDASQCGRICYQAFATVANNYNFSPDFPDVQAGVGLISMLLAHPGFFGVVAEREGQVLGSNFLDERGIIAGIGPITVDPQVQNTGVGRLLMDAAMTRAADRGFAGVRLVQAGYHCRSLSLYSKLGFEVREHLSCMEGPAMCEQTPGYAVRAANSRDLPACNALALRIHGHHRGTELQQAIAQETALVVERDAHIAGYSSHMGFFGHAVAESTEDLQALIAAAPSFAGPGILVPSRNGELLRWCFRRGLRIRQPMTLMTTGLYNEPQGAYLPSVLF